MSHYLLGTDVLGATVRKPLAPITKKAKTLKPVTGVKKPPAKAPSKAPALSGAALQAISKAETAATRAISLGRRAVAAGNRVAGQRAIAAGNRANAAVAKVQAKQAVRGVEEEEALFEENTLDVQPDGEDQEFAEAQDQEFAEEVEAAQAESGEENVDWGDETSRDAGYPPEGYPSEDPFAAPQDEAPQDAPSDAGSSSSESPSPTPSGGGSPAPSATDLNTATDDANSAAQELEGIAASTAAAYRQYLKTGTDKNNPGKAPGA